MKSIILLLLWGLLTTSSFSQIIYVVSGLPYNLFRLNLDDCTVDFVVQVQQQTYDISFDPEGHLYGIASNGNLFLIDTLTGQTTLVHDFNGQSFNSLTIGADGIIYTIGNEGELWSYDPGTDTEVYIGDIGYNATGDLTFYYGELYVATEGDRIVRINLANAFLSQVIIDENISGNILGIVSDVVDCHDIHCYAITGGLSDVYLIDFENKQLSLVCHLNINVGGGASTSEFLGSSPLQIDTLLGQDANCHDADGQIFVGASGGWGTLHYSINDQPFADENLFTGLSAGEYTLVIQDQIGCTDTARITLLSSTSPRVDTIIAVPSNCGNQNGTLTVLASGGSGPLEYAIDSLSFQTSGFFDGLASGKYSLMVRDSAGCFVLDQAIVDSLGGASIIQVEIQNTSCGEANGKITINVDSVSGTLYSIHGTSFQQENVFQDLSANAYLVTIQDANGCQDTLTVGIAPSEGPTIHVLETIPEKCGKMDGMITVRGEGGTAPYQYALETSTFQTDETFHQISSGSYTLFVIDQEACTNSIQIEIPEIAGVALLDYYATPTSCAENTGTISVQAMGGTGPIDYILDNHPIQSEPHFEQLGVGHYFIQAIDANGCEDHALIVIDREGCPIYIPNIFSPNGDGVNDVFKPETADAEVVKINKFYIFDRWGNNVYTAFNLDIHSADGWWDGMFKRFTLNPGVFAYYIEARFENGETETYKGDVTLVR